MNHTSRASGHMTRARGFTLIELMFVVSIIGILAAVALPSYNEYIVRARVTEVFSLASAAQQAVSDYYDRWGVLPADNAAAGMAPPDSYAGQNVRAMRVIHGVIEVKAALTTDRKDVKSLYLRPGVNRAYPTNALVWVCQHARAPAGHDALGRVGENPIENNKLPTTCK